MQFPMKLEITRPICDFASGVDYRRLPKHVIQQVGILFLDYVSSAHAGYVVNEDFNKALFRASCSCMGDVAEFKDSNVFFASQKMSAETAALLNAAYGHGADLDDGNKKAAGHIGTHVFPCLMALAEEGHRPYSSIVEAAVVGYEVFCRLGASVMPEMVDRGFHSTGMVGTLACAVACAKLMGLRSDEIYSALAIASTMSSGLLLVGETGQEIKPLNPAKAAQTGIFSARLASFGVKGSEKPLESSKGWIHAVSSDVDINEALGGLGERHSILECYMKAYPSCRHTHAVIETALVLRSRVLASDVEAVEVRTYSHAIELAGQIDVPKSAGEAKFSIKYAFATMFCKGHFSFDDLKVSAIDPEVKRLISKITLVADDGFEDVCRGVRGARVIVRQKSGRIVEEEVLTPKGEPERPFAFDDIVEKLSVCCRTDDGSRISVTDARVFADEQMHLWSSADVPFVFPRF